MACVRRAFSASSAILSFDRLSDKSLVHVEHRYVQDISFLVPPISDSVLVVEGSQSACPCGEKSLCHSTVVIIT
jgi:hypothetical protein